MQAGTGTVGTRTTMPALIAFGLVVVLTAGARVARDVVAHQTKKIEPSVVDQGRSSRERVDWDFVAESPVLEVLVHRPGIRPRDVVRTHAFGWKGPTLREVTSQHRYLRILRMEPTLSPVELVRDVARGS